LGHRPRSRIWSGLIASCSHVTPGGSLIAHPFLQRLPALHRDALGGPVAQVVALLKDCLMLALDVRFGCHVVGHPVGERLVDGRKLVSPRGPLLRPSVPSGKGSERPSGAAAGRRRGRTSALDQPPTKQSNSRRVVRSWIPSSGCNGLASSVRRPAREAQRQARRRSSHLRTLLDFSLRNTRNYASDSCICQCGS
jgi:hypothetical protein